MWKSLFLINKFVGFRNLNFLKDTFQFVFRTRFWKSECGDQSDLRIKSEHPKMATTQDKLAKQDLNKIGIKNLTPLTEEVGTFL